MQQILDVLSELAKNDSGMNALLHAESKEEVVTVLKKHGAKISEKEMDAFMEHFFPESDELNETVLETVSGGNTVSAWKALGIIIPLFMKGRKAK